MNILFLSPEVFPFARAGGLGDLSYYLPLALADRGHKIRTITPKYRWTEAAGYKLTQVGRSIKVPMSWREKTAQIYSTKVEGDIEVIFIGCDDLYNRDGLYGNEFGDYEDNAERFIFFSRAVMECIKAFDITPDVIHCHDWPTGLVPAYVRTLYRNLPNLKNTGTVFTFHNLGSQGIFWHYDYAMTGLDWELFNPEGIEFHRQMNMTKAGLVFADLITTVSDKFSQEALTPEYGFGLEGVLNARKSKTYSVLNGVDYNVWDPSRDPELIAQYSIDNLVGKAECRADLARTFDLDHDDLPIVAIVSRFLDRKGFDLISHGLENLLKLPLKLVFMGTGEDKYQVLLTEMAAAHPKRIGLRVAYHKVLAHRIMAGADIFLMPSRYEPCGLEQLYALKYGTIPVVRATGGLDDTVVDIQKYPETGTGFKFHDYSAEAMMEAMEAAVQHFEDKTSWESLMKRGMALEFSWEKAAAQYEDIYKKAIEESSGA